MALEIFPEDIQSAGQFMGKDFSDPERTAILQTLEPCDIQACPGSGKTTAVVAKLVILEEKIRGTNQGICVLSHTNAAKDEVRLSLGGTKSSLLRYPNFIGTIQSFIDIYLAIPAYILIVGHRPLMIDDNSYEQIASYYYQNLSQGTRYYLENNRSHQAQQRDLRIRFAKDYFSKISFRFSNLEDFVYFENNLENEFMANSVSASYQDVLRVKKIIFQAGYLTFHDAFSLGNWYLNKFPNIVSAIRARFPFIFIDEMQDTDRYQLELINKIFGEESIVQKFGDANQAIYNNRDDSFEPVWNPQADFQITSSRRLSRSIARLTRSLGVTPQVINGNPLRPDRNHTIICFDGQEALNVIPVYATLIEEEGLSNGKFMALGAVAKIHQQHLTIQNYWPGFERRLSKQTATTNFWEDLALAYILINQDGNLLDAKNHILNAILKLLRAQNVRSDDNRFYTKVTFENEVNKGGNHHSYTLNKKLLQWLKLMKQGLMIPIDHLIADIQTILSLIDVQLSQQTIGFIQQGLPQDIQERIAAPQGRIASNTYNHSENIRIEINTIHSAKGQTHLATLLMETFYYQYDLNTIKSYLWGENIRNPGIRIRQRFLPLTYVACTRPTDLLCIAIRSDHLNENNKNRLREFGWRILEI